MESPLNKKIQRSLERTAAKKKKDSNYIPVLTLRQQVLSLVTEANKSAQSERRVTPRSALIVMDRALASLAVVDEESRDFAVLREVSSFISTAQKTSVMTASAHTDLLPQGHPLSALNASLTPEEYRFKYAQWLAADADVSSAARPLVAAAFSAKPGSIERDHAFMRLSVTKENVPGYFKLDPAPIIAAFSDGNSSAARRARVALQWRDKRGRWVEMGRGANFRFRMPGGGVASASGVYVGVRPQQPGDNYTAGLIQVSGDKNLPDGIYAVRPSNTETYSARIPTEALKKAGITPGATPSQSMVGVPSQVDLLSTRRDAPEGWTKQDDNTFTSDDNYTAKVTDGEYTLFRQNEDGSMGDKVGEAGNWAEINDLANNDQDAYDEVKGQASSPEAREQVKARIATRTKYNEEFDRLEELVNSGVDQNGNKVPEGWEGTVRPGARADIERRAIGADRVLGEEQPPYVEYSKTYADDNGNPVVAKAMFMRDGKFYANDKEYDSWDAAEADIPNWIAAEEDKRGRKLDPIANIPSTEVTGKEIYERRIATGDSLDKVAKDLGIPREEVRRLEAEYGRTLDSGTDTADADKARNIEDVDKALKFLDAHMDDEGLSESAAIGISYVQGQVEDAKRYLENGNTKEAISSLGIAFDIMDGSDYPSEGRFPTSKNSAEAQDIVDKLITRLEESQPPAPPSGGSGGGGGSDLGDYKNSPEFIKKADAITKDWPTMDYATYINDKDPERVEMSFEPLPEGSKLIATGLGPEDGYQLLAKLPDGNYILANDTLDSDMPAFEQIYPASVGGPEDLYGDDNLSWEDATLDRLTNYDPYSGFNRLDAYGYFEKYGIPKNTDGDGPGEPFNYEAAKKIALDSSKPAQERYAAIFDGAAGRDFFEYVANSGVERRELDPSIPEGTEVVFADGDGQNLTLRYPDGTYHYLDTGLFDENDLIPVDPVSAYDGDGINDAVLKDLLDINSLVYARGAFMDSARQDLIAEGSSEDGDDEPPTPPSGPGGTPPKTPSPSTPSAPSLYKEFDVPNGAFELRGVDYEPEGRVDERSSDFTDDPERLATKFSVQDLIAAFSEAILGNSSDASVAEILNANVGDDDEIDAPSEVDVDVNMPQVALGSPSGAGRLEFNAGEEFILAESLFNALWHAGVDPNRVLANLYDSVNGDNKNLSKLIEAQGGTPSPEEAQLVDDITAEIRQIKDATPDDEPSIANQKNEPSTELKGSLIENVAIDFENPDYYIPDSSAYVPSQEEPDENGYTDNPQILATDYEEADLIMQMLEGITDGSGAALLNFGDITTEVPVEAIRDALQLQGINTNDILVDLKRESNDMSEPETTPEERRFPPTTGERQAIERPVNPRLQAHSQKIKDLIEQTGNTIDDDTADKIRDAIDDDWSINWSEATDEEIIEAIIEVAGPGVFGREIQEDVTPEVEDTPVDSADLPRDPSVDVPVDSPEYETPQYSYPGPREAGYTPNNVVLDSNGAAVGAGARVQALSDGRAGTVLAVQNIDTKSGRDADYVRIRFDDGTTAVRSARQIFGIDAGAPVAQGEGPGQLPPSRPNPVPQDPGQRFNEPAPAGTPVIAGDGSIPGVSLVDTPDDVAEFVNPDAKQADFAAWGLRAPEIARAGRERADVSKLVDLIEKEKAARALASDAPTADERDKAKAERQTYDAQIKKLIGDSFGIRPGVKFGKNNYSIGDGARVDYTIFDSGEVNFSIAFSIQDEQGKRIGEGSRTVRGLSETDVLGNTTRKWVVSNNLLKIYDKKDKKSGFASAYNRYMEDWYIANGFSSINVFAAGGGGWDGGFVWAVNGFNWKGSQANTVPTILRSMLRRSETSDEEKQIINRMLDRIAKDNPSGNYTPDTVPTPLEVAMIGWYPGATNWVGKKQMKSMGWYGEKRLDPQAIEQRQAINYNQSRNALKRVKDKENRAGVSRDLVLKMNSNEFADANPELAPYIDQIRDVLRSNRSLAVLSPAAKTALNRFTASQLLKGEDRTVALQDIFKLRTALDGEFKADNPLVGSKDFGVGNQLLDVSIDDVNANRVSGFTVRRLGMYESGVNETFMLTHNDSGQVFFVKKDSYAAQYQINGAGAEVQADVMLRASGVVAGYEARVSNIDPEIIVMQRAGAGVPLLGEPMTASNAIGNKLSINLPDGTTVKVNASNFMDLLHTPEDAVRVILVDLIISNMDRHNGNLLLAVDGTDTGKIRLLPIDHALSSFSPNTEGMQYTVSELFDNSFDNLYGMAMPVLTKRLKQEELLDLFKNEARVMMQELNNPANLPTGKELDLIIKNFGSLDEYRQKIQERIDSLLVPGNEAHEAFLNILKPGYWSTR